MAAPRPAEVVVDDVRPTEAETLGVFREGILPLLPFLMMTDPRCWSSLLLLILYPMILLSDAFTPHESMGPFMRYASAVSPVSPYVDFGYQVLFKGNGLAYVWPDVAGILVLGVALFGMSVWRFVRLVP